MLLGLTATGRSAIRGFVPYWRGAKSDEVGFPAPPPFYFAKILFFASSELRRSVGEFSFLAS